MASVADPIWLVVACPLLMALAGALLGIIACALARRDQARMRQGLMDPGGMGLARRARAWGLAGTVVGACVLTTWAVALCIP